MDRHAARVSDRRDPVCGMIGTIPHDGRWFCSRTCLDAYELRRGHGGAAARHVLRLRDPWVWAPLSGALLATADWWWPAAADASRIYRDYVRMVLAPFLAGVAIGGAIEHFIPQAYILRLLAGRRRRVIGRAAALGVLASTCSHGVIALSMELYRKGASTPAAVTFLLASPWANMALSLLLVSLFHLQGLVIILLAVGIAIVTGLIFQVLERRGLIEANPSTQVVPLGFSIRQDLAARWRAYPWTANQLAADLRGVLRGMVPLGRMVLGWVQLGLLLGSILGATVPAHVFHRWFGASVAGLLLTLLLATVMEVCSEGTAPLAFELYRRTGALGNAFAFLMGGVVTDYTELAVVWTGIGRRTALWMLLVTLPQVIVCGLLLNAWSG